MFRSFETKPHKKVKHTSRFKNVCKSNLKIIWKICSTKLESMVKLIYNVPYIYDVNLLYLCFSRRTRWWEERCKLYKSIFANKESRNLKPVIMRWCCLYICTFSVCFFFRLLIAIQIVLGGFLARVYLNSFTFKGKFYFSLTKQKLL